MKTLTEQLASAKRELALRNNAYPDWVSKGRMKSDAAHHEIDCMTCIVMTLEKMAMLGEVSEEMKERRAMSAHTVYNPDKDPLVNRCLCCGADIDKGTMCENCTDTPANVAQADLI